MLKQNLILFFFFLEEKQASGRAKKKELWQDEAVKTSKDLDWLNSNYFIFLAFLYCMCLTWKCVED